MIVYVSTEYIYKGGI